jgi:2,4-dienoyl-CoA reductase-like NADH-dependent reductase (Old Yellow Enzyme family)
MGASQRRVELIITGAIITHPTSPIHPLNKITDTDVVIPTFLKMSDEVQNYGARAIAQLSHSG